MGKHLVIFEPWGIKGYVEDGQSLLEASSELGVEIESLCGGRGKCGKCLVEVKAHLDHLSPPSDEEQGFLPAEGYRLACAARIHGEVSVFVPEESRAKKQIVRKTLREIEVEIDPTVRVYYVELSPPTLEDPQGDWERLQDELKRRFDLQGLTIDYQTLLAMQRVLRGGDWKATVYVWRDREVIGVRPGLVEEFCGMAVDIGTTTVAAYLCDMRSGQVLAEEAITNPQAAYGEDLISRIHYAMTHDDGLDRLNRAIVEGINELIGGTTYKAGLETEDVHDVVVVGNTAMHHLFLRIDPEHLGRTPFSPALHRSLDVKARDLRLNVNPGAYVHLLPIEAGFVGADNVGVLIAEEPYRQDQMLLIIDIGTNGEIVLGNRDTLLSASCATGPAFEGMHMKHGMRAAPGAIERVDIDAESLEVRFLTIDREPARGICGSGVIDLVGEMVRVGLVRESGRFNTDLSHPRLREGEKGLEFVVAWADETDLGQDILFSQADLRAVQLAKGALYAGAKLLMRRLGIDRVDGVILAGAFGSYLDKRKAMTMGLFPDCDLEKVQAVGNAAGDGARLALLNRAKRLEADQVASKVEYVELTVEPSFTEEFTQAMYFPHSRDEFPHVWTGASNPKDDGGML